jgi:hypothetical protein
MRPLWQHLVNHARYWQARYALLTRVLKPMTTALWQSRGNRAATARRELEHDPEKRVPVFRKDHAQPKS